MLRSYRAQLQRIDARLSQLLMPEQRLGPPLPATPEEQEAWSVYHTRRPPPTLPEWQPHACVPRSGDGGFMLNEQTVCYERGRCPEWVHDALMRVFADGFHHSLEGMRKGLRCVAHDFFIAIKAKTGDVDEIVAGCMVELRCSAEEGAIPYLFIYQVVTKSSFCRHGLAQQMVHAADTLAFLLKHCSETNPSSIWRESLHGRRLFTALTVDRTQEQSYWGSLVKLYTRCGLHARDENTPEFEFHSFTPYIDYDCNLEHNPTHYIPMYKESMPNVAYDNGQVRILVLMDGQAPHTAGPGYQLYYHTIPDDAATMTTIKTTGLTVHTHDCLHMKGASDVYLVPDRLSFSRHPPAASENTVFAVLARCKEEVEEFELRTSIPHWFAAFIGKADGTPRVNW